MLFRSNVWSWLTKCPPLPPICLGRTVGTCAHVIKAVRALKDIEVLKSYFFLVWSEWNTGYLFDNSYYMWISIQEDFGGIGMGHHRVDLLQRLDHVLGQLDYGLEYLKHCDPGFDENYLRIMKHVYQTHKEVLLKTNLKAISRTLHLTITPFRVLTPVPCACRTPRNTYVRTPSPVPVASQLECSVPPLPLFVPPLRCRPPESCMTTFWSPSSRLTCSWDGLHTCLPG